MSDPYVGKLTYFRVYSGKVKAGERVLNSTTGKTERIGRLLQMHANHREEREEIGAGDIVAAVGLKATTTGDTLCRRRPLRSCSSRWTSPSRSSRSRSSRRPRPTRTSSGGPAAAQRGGPDVPRPHGRGDRPDDHRRHGRAPPRDHRRPPDARVQRSTPTSASPQVAYRETVTKRSRRSRARFVRQTGGRGQYGHVGDRPGAGRAGRGLRVRRQDRRRHDPAGVHPGRRAGHPGGDGARRPRGLPGRRRPGRARRRLLPRRRLERDGVQDRRLDGVQGRRAAGEARCCSSR